MSKRVIAIVAVAAALCLALVGCGSSAGSSAGSPGTQDSASSSADINEFAGTWMLESMDDSTDEELDAMINMGYAMFFVFDENGDVTYEFMGSKEEGTYEVTGAGQAKLTGLDKDNWTDTATITDGKLSIDSADGGACTFGKTTEDEHKAYNEEYDLGD